MKFVIGDVYFIVMCADEQLRIPVMQTLIYIGTRTRDSGESFLYFREIIAAGEELPFSVEHQYAEDLLVDGAGLLIRLQDYLMQGPRGGLKG